MIKKETKLAAERLGKNPLVKKFLEEKFPEYEFRIDSNSAGFRLELTHKEKWTVKASLFLGATNREAEKTLDRLHEFLWLLNS